jgi:hypothetical protein
MEANMSDTVNTDGAPPPTGEQYVTNTFKDHLLQAWDIFVAKYLSRGGENISRQGFPGVLDRIRYDKMVRLERISRLAHMQRLQHDTGSIDAEDMLSFMKEAGVRKDDAIDDLYDIANYSIILIMLLEGEWQ